MEIQRRVFLQWLGAQALLVGVASRTSAGVFEPSANLGFSILQGATGASQTQFSVLHPVGQQLSFYVLDGAGVRVLPKAYSSVDFPGASDQLTKLFFDGLISGVSYSLVVVDAGSQQILDQREFQTLRSGSGPLRFAVCSCMDDHRHEAQIWRSLVEARPDVIFFVGDSVYADAGAPSSGADPAHLWKRFCEARQKLDIFFSKRLIPIIATWDDQDFGRNDAHAKQYAYVRESQQNFLNFFAQDPAWCDLLTRGPGVSSSFIFNDQLFLLMDNRSFRQERGSADRYAHWGAEQERWMLDLMAAHAGPVFLMNGTQMVPQMPFKESMSGDHAGQFLGVCTEMKRLPNRVVFVSGDVHYSEVSTLEPAILGYASLEITSSSIHSQCIPGAPGIIPNKRRLLSTGSRNYTMVESIAEGYSVRLKVNSCGADGRCIFELKAVI